MVLSCVAELCIYRLGSSTSLLLPPGSDGYLKVTDLEETGKEGYHEHGQTLFWKNLHLKCFVFLKHLFCCCFVYRTPCVDSACQ